MTSTGFRTQMSDGYDAAGSSWDTGPGRLYARLADDLVSLVDDEVAGRLVLDAGAGTGLVARALVRRGARAVALDRSIGMLGLSSGSDVARVVGDVDQLPLGAGGVDGSASGFCLNHLADPVRALREMGRVTAPGGFVVASVFGPQAPHPAKQATDLVAARHGFEAPSWYATMKALEPVLGDVEALAGAARAAGLCAVETVERHVDSGVSRPEDLVRYRLGMAHLAPFVASLSPAQREALVGEAVEALRDAPPLRPTVVLLRSRVRL